MFAPSSYSRNLRTRSGVADTVHTLNQLLTATPTTIESPHTLLTDSFIATQEFPGLEVVTQQLAGVFDVPLHRFSSILAIPIS
jgi:hypothetical protein